MPWEQPVEILLANTLWVTKKKMPHFIMQERRGNRAKCVLVPAIDCAIMFHLSPLQPTAVNAHGIHVGALRLAQCDGSISQSWNITTDPTVATNVESEFDVGCWEIDGCGGSTVDTNYGCKALPKGPLPCKAGTCCNMAWIFKRNGQIMSGMAAQQCLQVSATDESTVVVGPCTGADREKWRRVGSTIVSFVGGCIDNNATTPLNPQYGPLVLANCGERKCRYDLDGFVAVCICLRGGRPYSSSLLVHAHKLVGGYIVLCPDETP
eukprot:m.400086 g.400086  ORF g.400086 m.400086 type:complete len:265 (-) comp28385_c1_seq3:30-824(-)